MQALAAGNFIDFFYGDNIESFHPREAREVNWQAPIHVPAAVVNAMR
ncbi:hypothetical protein ACIHDR_26270 [Nocardia sp. NPDC052278]